MSSFPISRAMPVETGVRKPCIGPIKRPGSLNQGGRALRRVRLVDIGTPEARAMVQMAFGLIAWMPLRSPGCRLLTLPLSQIPLPSVTTAARAAQVADAGLARGER